MTESITVTTMEVKKDNWSETRFLEETLSGELGENEVFLKADRFALTANNISYAGAGDLLGYWGFFPAAEGWGRIPSMCYGEVLASAHPEIAVGERVWGFFPMSTHLKVLAGQVKEQQFVDVSPHRAEYAPAYAQFQRAAANPIYDLAREDQDSLLRGLFLTGWLCEDFLFDNQMFGASACVVTSASSKTSVALGYSVKQRGEIASIGLTSAANVDFCRGLGCYDEVVSYDDLESLDPSRAVVMADMAGNASLVSRLHHHFTDNMKYSASIGATHYDQTGVNESLPGATPEFFFAPTQIQKRSAEWSAAEFAERSSASFVSFREFCDGWLKIVTGRGPDAVAATYQAVLKGGVNPTEGQILSMWPE
jgi:hypothetical protein